MSSLDGMRKSKQVKLLCSYFYHFVLWMQVQVIISSSIFISLSLVVQQDPVLFIVII